MRIQQILKEFFSCGTGAILLITISAKLPLSRNWKIPLKFAGSASWSGSSQKSNNLTSNPSKKWSKSVDKFWNYSVNRQTNKHKNTRTSLAEAIGLLVRRSHNEQTSYNCTRCLVAGVSTWAGQARH